MIKQPHRGREATIEPRAALTVLIRRGHRMKNGRFNEANHLALTGGPLREERMTADDEMLKFKNFNILKNVLGTTAERQFHNV